MPQSDKFNFAAKTPIEDIGGGLKRQMLGFDDTLMAVKVWFDEGAEGYIHAHHHAQVTYVEAGEFHISIDGEIKILTAGDSFYVPPHAEHGAQCPTGGVLIDIFSPMREDFLEQ